MRVLDPHEPLHPPSSKKRGRKKSKQPPIDYFFKARMKVPTNVEGLEAYTVMGERFLDDWAPNLAGPEGKLDEVEVSILGWRKLYGSKSEHASYRVAVWGGDDLGYERDYMFDETTPEKLVRMVLDFPEPLTKKYLVNELGFWHA